MFFSLRSLHPLLILLLFIVGPSDREAKTAEQPAQPNIILILADDLGYCDLGCYGAKQIETPNIDRLASEGVRFTDFYVAQSVCTASRAALMTGCYSNRVGMSGALNHTSMIGIHPNEILLSNLLKGQGYSCGIFGKWHLGHQRPFLPTNRGFDEWAGIPYSNDNGPLHPVSPDFPPLPWYENDQVTEQDPDQSHFTKRITDRSIDFIRRNRERPFFLYVPHIMPHVPIFASDSFRGQSKHGLYGDVIQELDWSVGEIVNAVDSMGLKEKTLILFTSDNGPFLSYGEHAGSAIPLREGKLTTFEGGLRVPGIARWPNTVEAGRVSREIVSTIDLFDTIASLTHAKVPSGNRDSIDLSPLLLGKRDAKGRSAIWFYAGEELQAVRMGNWKLHVPHKYLTVAGEPGKGGKPSMHGKGNPLPIEQSGIYGIASRHGYRVVETELALYDLQQDPGETTDLSLRHPEVVQQLQQLVSDARKDLGDTITGIKPTGSRPVGDARKTP